MMFARCGTLLEAKILLLRIQDLLTPNPPRQPLTDEVFDKYKVRSGPFFGMTTDEYLRIVRDGDSR
jgi:hypothetical protein